MIELRSSSCGDCDATASAVEQRLSGMVGAARDQGKGDRTRGYICPQSESYGTIYIPYICRLTRISILLFDA